MKLKVFLLILMLCVPFLLASCFEEENPVSTTEATQEIQKPREDLFAGDPSSYAFLYHSSEKVLQNSISEFTGFLNFRYGSSVKFKVDTTQKNVTAKEILVGETNREESIATKALIKNPYDFFIRKMGDKLVVIGGCEDATARALDYLCANYFENTLLLEKEMDFYWDSTVRNDLAFALSADYQIVYPVSATVSERNSAGDLAGVLTAISGKTVKAVSDKTAAVAKEILIGKTNRQESLLLAKEVGTLDWAMKTSGDKILLLGGSSNATAQAVLCFTDALYSGEITVGNLASLSKSMIFAETVRSKSTASDLDRFVPSWSENYSPATWLSDLTEKRYAVTAPDARNMSASAGGDSVNYPAYSLEAFASAVKAGADLLKVNVYLTRDGIPVVAPDENLRSFTNFEANWGKNGLPLGNKISDWNFTELQQLCYLDKSFSVSSCKICSLWDVIALCKNRCLLGFDILPENYYNSIRVLFTESDAFGSFFEEDPKDEILLSSDLKKTATVSRLSSWGLSNNSATVKAVISEYQTNLAKPNHWMRRLFTPVSLRKGLAAESPENYQYLAEGTMNFLQVNDIVAYCKYISENQVSALVDEDLRESVQNYSISESDLTGRVMVVSDLHYYYPQYPQFGFYGTDYEAKIQLFISELMKEYNSPRGLDAVLILGDLATDNYIEGRSNNTEYYKVLYEKYLKTLPIPVYVLPGNHDSFPNEMWKATFGTDRQYSFSIGKKAFIMLDNFTTGDGGSNYIALNTDWFKKEIAKYSTADEIIVCSHYLTDSDVQKVQNIAASDKRIIAIFDGHTHLFEVRTGNATLINTGDIAYTAYHDTLGNWNFNFLDLRSLWSYEILEWSEDTTLVYRTLLPATYDAGNVQYSVPESIRQSEMILSK